MFKNRDSLGKEFELKISLSYSATLNDTTELINNNPIYNLLSDYSEIENIMKIDIPEKMKFFYFNRNKINEILYEEDKVFEINSNLMQNKLSEYFYFILLIENNKNIINFAYSYNFIKEVNDKNKISNNDILREVIMSKFILELINNFRGTNEFYDNDNQIKNEINDLETFNKKRIENNELKIKGLELNAKDIINKKIEQIYIGIIANLIKTNKIDDYEKTCNIMIQLGLKNINITEIMLRELNNILKSDKDYMKKYIINNKSHLFNKDIINFYYTLFKYILKKQIYIYQIPFLEEARKQIIRILKTNKIEENDEKLKYIISFFTHSFYSLKLNNLKENNNYSIIHHEENLENPDITSYTELIREMSNGYILRLNNKIENPNNEIKNKNANSNYNSNLNSSKNIYRSKNGKYSKDDENINFKYIDINSDKKGRHIYNIIETNDSIKDKYKKDIQVIECSKEGLKIYNLSVDGSQKEIKYSHNLCCTGCFEVKDNNYIVIGEKGMFHFDSLNIHYNFLYYNINETPFSGCIKINDDYIVLTSNSKLQNGGEDLLCIYDTKIKRLIHKLYYSFTIGVNGLILMDILQENNNNNKQLVLCACKKYTESQKME